MSTYGFQFVGTGLLATFNASTPAWQHYLYIIPASIGFGGSITVLLIALISSVSVKGIISCTSANDRSSNCYRDELFVPKHRICGWYHSNSVCPPKSFEEVAHRTYSWAKCRIRILPTFTECNIRLLPKYEKLLPRYMIQILSPWKFEA
jgi:hypothetical protein